MKTIKQIDLKVKRVVVAAEYRELYNTRITDVKRAVLAIRTIIGETDEERFVAIPLDVKNKPIGYQVVALGGPDCCHVDPRNVFRSAILVGASAIIVAHNHPSGEVDVSPEDFEITGRLMECGKMLGIPVFDHLIVGHNQYLSMKENGLI